MSFATRPGTLLPFSVLRPYLVSFAPSHRISGLLFALEGSQRFGANTSCQKYYSISFLGAPWPAPVIFRANNLTRCFAAFSLFFRRYLSTFIDPSTVKIVGIAIEVLDNELLKFSNIHYAVVSTRRSFAGEKIANAQIRKSFSTSRKTSYLFDIKLKL